MQVRDKLNTLEKYKSLIEFNKNTINEWLDKVSYLYKAEKAGIKKYARPNLEIIEYTKKSILNYQQKILLAIYSAGYPIEIFQKEYIKTFEEMLPIWRHRGGYLSMLDILSIAIILDLKNEQRTLFDLFNQQNKKDKFQIKDFLLDFLFKQNNLEHEIYPDFMIAKPYSLLKEVIELSKTDKAKAVKKLKSYLEKNWFSALKRQDLIQETHKSPHGTHCGYWSFESGALVKILGLDDSILKDQQYYPYDLVHYKES
ncbi:PoNe immunity protein domain-containing protein [Pasteurella sp. PK-2025]|uniref:PoNe immunity protein domain-containing protein n=1 Tax=Pasteurella sp. PK-2025 TaxID=3413133 RepID=UPI003C77AC3D